MAPNFSKLVSRNLETTMMPGSGEHPPVVYACCLTDGRLPHIQTYKHPPAYCLANGRLPRIQSCEHPPAVYAYSLATKVQVNTHGIEKICSTTVLTTRGCQPFSSSSIQAWSCCVASLCHFWMMLTNVFVPSSLYSCSASCVAIRR